MLRSDPRTTTLTSTGPVDGVPSDAYGGIEYGGLPVNFYISIRSTNVVPACYWTVEGGVDVLFRLQLEPTTATGRRGLDSAASTSRMRWALQAQLW